MRKHQKTNHEQLYVYLKQHEKHAAQDRLIIERITHATNDQLAFVSTVQPHAQSFRATLPQTNNQLRTSSNTQNQATIQDGRAIGAHIIELGMPMRVKENWSSVIIVMGLDILHRTSLSQMLDEEELLFLAGEQANTVDA
ncbi:hypothetical protein Tco_1179128, partial [Tanacetum coccineum]